MTPQPDGASFQPAVDVTSLPGGTLAALEAVLMVIDEPISATALAAATGLPQPEVESALRELADEYAGIGGHRPRGFVLREVAGGWRIYSSPVFADAVGRYVTEGQSARLTQAALETLAIVAYRQPVTRGQVSAVRGVNVDGVMRTLSARGLIAEIGADPSSGALLYGSTGYLLERLGIGSIDELPPLAPLLPDISELTDEPGEGDGMPDAGADAASEREPEASGDAGEEETS